MAFKAVKSAVSVGKDLENVVGSMSKWYGAVSDIRKCQQNNKNPPIFKKLFAAGSIEEEALQLLMHDKAIREQEKELETLLNWRYGFGTWKELIELRRKIKAEREATLYKQEEKRRVILDTVAIIVLFTVIVLISVGIFYGLHATGKI
jgi:hypothetical protein